MNYWDYCYLSTEQLEKSLSEESTRNELKEWELKKLQELLEDKKMIAVETAQWEKSTKEKYLTAVSNLANALNEAKRTAPPLIRESELDPFWNIENMIANLEMYDSEDVWNGSQLC